MTGIKLNLHGSEFHKLLFFIKILTLLIIFVSVFIQGLFPGSDRFCRANEQNSMVIVEKQGNEKQPEFYVYNRYYGPVEVEFYLTRALNIVSSPLLPARFVIPQASKMKTFTLSPSQLNSSFSYSYKYSFVLGSPKAEHRPPKPYRPPFPNGNRFRISRRNY